MSVNVNGHFDGDDGPLETEPEVRNIEWVEVAGRQLPAATAVCPDCKTLWLDMEFDTSDPTMWKARCPKGHEWVFVAPAPA